MDNVITQLGVGGIFAILVLREVFNFLSTRKKNGSEGRMKEQIAKLYEWHNMEDANGVKRWYNKSTLDSNIATLSRNIQEQTLILKQLSQELRDVREEVRRAK